ncbi:MAG: transcription elongation factor GreA [Chloroflexota bacterium]|jgi:transcription elongation factor GreA|nr:transcription elongation factor GreA [Chloroflexota bacterium]
MSRGRATEHHPPVPTSGSGGTVRPVSPTHPGAADLIRSIGLLADGPVRWGSTVPARRGGVYVVELGAPLAQAPVEMTRVGKWLETVPGLRLDGEVPTSKALHARLASLWWPDATVLYAGATAGSIGGRVAALLAHVPGERQPHAEGQWLHLLRNLDGIGLRIWWAETKAPEESLDALFDAFGAATGLQPMPGRPAGALKLPWANTRRPTGERQAHGIVGAIVPESPKTPEPPRRVVDVAPGDAEGARVEDRNGGTTRRGPSGAPPRPARSARTAARPAPVPQRAPTVARSSTGARVVRGSRAAAPEPIQLSKGALDRMTTELDELTRVKRREVVARIKSAREHGDLKENAEYHAAREEQSFLEGRVQALEDRIRRAVVVDEVATGKVIIGSKVTVEIGGDELEYTIVGSAEADPAKGRLSMASPVGAALLGAVAGAEVDVRTPRGSARYKVLSVE